jgi:hypothetical protein
MGAGLHQTVAPALPRRKGDAGSGGRRRLAALPVQWVKRKRKLQGWAPPLARAEERTVTSNLRPRAICRWCLTWPPQQ